MMSTKPSDTATPASIILRTKTDTLLVMTEQMMMTSLTSVGSSGHTTVMSVKRTVSARPTHKVPSCPSITMVKLLEALPVTFTRITQSLPLVPEVIPKRK
jgi:hypothetical protein